MQDMMQAVAPSEDVNSYPKSCEVFCTAVDSLVMVRQSDWNNALKANNLSETTGTSKHVKSEKLLAHLAANHGDERCCHVA
eukprot:1473471-Pyramimonas_sp.AAC.1